MFQNPIGLIICGNILITRKIGSGSFGEIYQAYNKENLTEKFALKLEKSGSQNYLLNFQTRVYQHLFSMGGFRGLPQIFQFKTEKSFHILIMELLGPSIQDIFMTKNCRFSLKSALMVGYQMVERIRQIHRREIIHRDIKPDNFLIGTEQNSNVLYIVDFNLSKRYMKDGQHIPYKESKQLIGTPRYASINNHKGIEQSRRDDIQSIGYVILYLLRGSLPWQNLPEHRFKTKNQLIFQKKIESSPQQLCRDCPKQLASFIQYARSLDYQQQPNYEYLRHLLTQAMYIRNIKMDLMFNQEEQKEEQQKQKQVQQKLNNHSTGSSLRIRRTFASRSKQNSKRNQTQEKSQKVIVKEDKKVSTLIGTYHKRLSLNINSNKNQNLRKLQNLLQIQNGKQEINQMIQSNYPQNYNYKKKLNQKTNNKQNRNNINDHHKYNQNKKLVHRQRSNSINVQQLTIPTSTNSNQQKHINNQRRKSQLLPKNIEKILIPLINKRN